MQNETTRFLETIELNPTNKATASVIWLHGLGADGNDFTPIIPELNLPNNLSIRFIFPNAPMQPVTINNGYIMRAWYDIVSLESTKHADEEGIKKSVHELGRLIEREENLGIPSERIILAGFSQGAVIALSTGLTYHKRLAGILALSGYLPFSEKIMATKTLENKNTPIFLAHGTGDNVVPYFLGEATRDILQKNGLAVAWHSYRMAHSVCMEEIQDIGKWIKETLLKDSI